MLQGFKPMLAINMDNVTKMPEQLCASYKLDGIRAVCFGGVLYSRSLKPIPNKHIQTWAKEYADVLEGFDGELIVGEPNAEDVFNVTTSGVMSRDGTPEFKFFVFDIATLGEKPYNERYEALLNSNLPPLVDVLPHHFTNNMEEINVLERQALSSGYEGLMVRDARGFYKHGRAGKVNPQIMKVKRFTDNEFEVVGFECEYENTNEAKVNELGHTERSTSKEGKVSKDSLGTLLLWCPWARKVFGCGSGFTKEQREELWKVKETLIGKHAKVKYFDIGVVDLPRFPVFVGFRAAEDMS